MCHKIIRLFKKHLTLSKTTDEDPDYFEVVKSWVMRDDTEIEVLRA